MSWVQIPSPTPNTNSSRRTILGCIHFLTSRDPIELRREEFLMSIFWIDLDGLRLGITPRPRGNDWLADDLGRLRQEGVDVIVSALTSAEVEELGLTEEARECVGHDLTFISFPIEDRSVPNSQVDFAALIDRLAEHSKNGQAIVVHRRAGIGRSSLITAALLIRRGCSPNSVFQIIGETRGCPVPDTTEQQKWLEDWAKTVD
jgi:protein-tyrosine phosphatase